MDWPFIFRPMSRLAVIHLSDIHIHSEKDQCLSQVSAIASACFHSARKADACLIAITGDIAFSGAKAEYIVATELLIAPLVQKLKEETGRQVFVAMVPGNHDCVLKPSNVVRETLIDAVVEAPEKAELADMVDQCTQVQSHFFEFAQHSLLPAAVMPSRLFWQQEFYVGKRCVRISSLNAAWMSRLPEEQGQLVYPINKFEDQLASPACLHLALLHHPFNWYCQSAYHQLRKRLRLSCTAVLSGHEHIGNSGQIDEQLTGSSLFFEAPALQPHGGTADAGFSIHLFDLDNKEVSTQGYKLTRSGVETLGDETCFHWSDDSIVHGALDLTSEFASTLADAGGNFTHSAKEKLTIDDIFVWPDVRKKNDADVARQHTQSASELTAAIVRGESLLFYGDEKSGKSTLLLWYFRDLLSRGFAPVLLSGTDLNLKGGSSSEKRIQRAITEQYKNADTVMSLPRERRILLVDDIDRLKSGLHTLPALFDYANRHFAGICLTACTGLEVTNLTDASATAALSTFDSYELMKFGLKLRHRLIKKWCSLSSVATKPELDQRVHDVETIMNTVIGKQLVPEHPIYLLILLQSCEQHRHGEIQNSGLSFYYQYLITKSLGEVGVKPGELDEHFNYLSILAWRFQSQGCKALDIIELRAANKEFSDRYVTVDLAERLPLLVRARILTKQGDCYGFAYPYVYYFFIGRYLSRNLDDPEIRAWVQASCKKLYLRDRAHAIMFLTHHVENKWVIGQICNVLRDCFSDKKPIELNGDTEFLNGLVERCNQMTLPLPNVDENQSAIREKQDNAAVHDEGDESEEYDYLDLTAKWNLLHKTAEIVGLILKNHYGSLERGQKKEMIQEVFDAPLRALRLWLEEVAEHIPELLQALCQHELQENPRLGYEEAEKRAKKRVFNLFGMVATGTIASAGGYVSAEKLREDVTQVVDAQPTNSYLLIGVAARLLRPGAIPLDAVKKLAGELEKHPYAFGVLQSLGFAHMYMYHTDEPQKQALCSSLKISFESAKVIEIKKQAKLLR
ncbi:STAND family AAA ATPase [Noviherbaspirillum galbum]|nr:metallophosphoesterase [Noviherbaspirillum galbum]